MIGLDGDGYPVVEDLERIKGFKPFEDDVFAFMDELRGLWAYADSGYWKEEPDPDLPHHPDQRKYSLRTAGWSGNEETIATLQENPHFFWALFWHSTTRGGHYVFKVYQPKKA